MALKPDTLAAWVGRVSAADADYPLGSAKNETSEGADDGTTLLAEFINDLWGMLQGLLDRAGITPSGDPDTVLASDYLDALFSSGIIDSDAIDNITVDKLSNGVLSLDNSTINLISDLSYLTLKDYATPTKYIEIKNNILVMYNALLDTFLTMYDGAFVATGNSSLLRVSHDPSGLIFSGGNDPSEDKTISYRKMEARFPGTGHVWNTWTDNGTDIGYTTSGLETNLNFGDETSIISASMRYQNSTSETLVVPCILSAFYDSGGGKLGCNVKFPNFTGLSSFPVAGTERIYIEYDGNVL